MYNLEVVMNSTLRLMLERNSDETLLQYVSPVTLRNLFTEETGEEADLDLKVILKRLRESMEQVNRVRIGVHQSFDGLRSTWLIAEYYGNNTFQCFLRNNRNLKRRFISADDIACFNANARKYVNPVCAFHAPYVINPASPDKDKHLKAMGIIDEDLRVLDMLTGDTYYVVHPGSYTEYGERIGMQVLTDSVNRLMNHKPGSLCLETMAGQGTQMFRVLDQMDTLLSKFPTLGLCVDTCHIFAAGIKFQEFLQFVRKYASQIKVVHVNDSTTAFGSHVDRHQNIGYGLIPTSELDPFILEINTICPDAPFILETPAARADEDLLHLRKLFKYNV